MDANREQVIAWCKTNKCDFKTPVFPPPEGWAWVDGKDGLVLTTVFTITDHGDDITKNDVYC